MDLSRRTLLAAASGAAMTTLRPGLSVALAAENPASERDILVVVFLRFGADGLTLIPPSDDGEYHRARPTLAVPASGNGAGLPIGALDGAQFFMNPNLPELKALYDAKKLAVVHAVGIPTESRSHFVSQDKMERGNADGDAPLAGGWLGRHLTARHSNLTGLGAITSGAEVDVTLQGYPGAVAVVPKLELFNVTGGNANLSVIERINTGAEPAVASARATIDTIKNVQASLAKLPPADDSKAGYTTADFSAALKSVATLIKANVGLEVATVDYGGWDHHNNLNTYFGPQAKELSVGLNAFWNDLAAYQGRLTIVTMTEFGRRVQENANAGLDHGSASVMMALGGAVNGGRLYGRWPGLKPKDLHAGDLPVTTDYRQVLQEILVKRCGQKTPKAVFPTLPYQPLGVIKA